MTKGEKTRHHYSFYYAPLKNQERKNQDGSKEEASPTRWKRLER